MPFKQMYANAYDALYHDKDYEKECDFIEELFQKYDCNPKTILDLGCGTGGHALILAKRGYKVTGVDRSLPMLGIARKKAKEAQLNVEFIEGDVCNISLGRRFDAVISMFAVMSYQLTNKAIASVCNLAKESLNSSGLFMFDCWNGFAVLNDKPMPRIKEVGTAKGERIIRFTHPEFDLIKHQVKVNFRVWRITANKIKESTEVHTMRFIFPQEMKYFLETAGFEIIHFYPFLDTEAHLTEKDWNMVVVGK